MRHRALTWLLAALVASSLPLYAQSKPYTPKNGVLNWKAILLGGAFRITTAIPLHGDFSRYDSVDIVRSESVIGPDVPAEFLRDLTRQFAGEFKKGGRFARITVVESYEVPLVRVQDVQEVFHETDALEMPLRTAADLARFDRDREQEARAPVSATLVVQSQVIDYARGNKLVQLLFLDLGNAIVTLRISYRDKVTGEVLGRSVVSSDNSSKVVPSVFSTRTALTGVAEGLVDQVTRRKVAGER